SNQKINLAKILLKGKIDPKKVYVFDDSKEVFDFKLVEKKPYIIWTGWNSGGIENGVMNMFYPPNRLHNERHLKTFAKKFHAMTNISRVIGDDDGYHHILISEAKKDCYKSSLVEYGRAPYTVSREFFSWPSKGIYNAVALG